jgi:V8-like Glu-specific endopeptidase
LFVAISAGCLPSAPSDNGTRTEDVIGGATDTGDPAVVALFSHQPGANRGELCTATLISPTVLLTAAHCTLPQPGAIFEAVFNPTFNGAPQSTIVQVKEVHSNPNFNINNLQGGHDVGVAILATPSTVTPIAVNTTAIAQSQVNQAVRIVGYGLNKGPAQTGSGAGTKRTATTVLDAVSAGLLKIGVTGKDTCSGDSGGPAFMKINGVEQIVGVTSFGNGTCSNGGFDTRIDAELAFINQFVNTSNPPPGTGNPPVTGGGNSCVHGICTAGAALQSDCDPCATQICAQDPFCCTNNWDRICVREVTAICGQTCP